MTVKKVSTGTKYVIIGNGVASIGAIEAIRKNDKTGSITVLTDEKYPCYGRPLISYYLEGSTTRDKMDYRPAGFYAANNVKLVLGSRADRIDALSHKVWCGDSEYSYDKLLIATGSSPVVPPTEGYENVKRRYTFNKLDDALEARARYHGSRVGVKYGEPFRQSFYLLETIHHVKELFQ